MGERRRLFFDAENFSYIEGKKGGRDQGYASAVVWTGMAFRATLSRGASAKGLF